MYRIIAFAVLISTLACADKPDLSVVPKIEYIGASKKKMIQGSVFQDTTVLTLKFEDGDGDLGFTTLQDRKFDLQIKDIRTGSLFDQYIIPSIPEQGSNNGIRGIMRVTLFTTCCTIQPCDPFLNQPDEALPLELSIVDRAGNRSNVVKINDLTLKCF